MLRHHLTHMLASASMVCFMADPAAETPAAGGAAETPAPIDPAQGVVAEELPEGYKDWEDYNQKNATQDTTAGTEGEDSTTGANGADTVEGGEATETPEAAEARVKELVDFTTDGMAPEMKEKVSPLVEAYAKNGDLTPAQITEAAAATGLSEEMVRQFMDGGKFRQQESTTQAADFVKPFHDTFGGADEFGKFQLWSSEKDASGKLLNISAEDDAAYKEALENNSPKAALALLKQMKTAYEATGKGKPARDLTNGSQTETTAAAGGYASQAEMEADMNNPKYRSDAAFRAGVEAKIAKSSY